MGNDVAAAYYPYLALMLARGIGPSDCFRLPADPEAAFEMLRSPAGLRELSSRLGKRVTGIPWGAFEAQVRAIEGSGVGVVTYRDSAYPQYLLELRPPVPLIFYKGRLDRLARRGVAIVGTRAASARGCDFAMALARELAGFGVVVASGAAKGIDSAAHRGALLEGGATIGILGTGLDVPYPPENAALIAEIGARGCLISEQPMGTLPRRHVFPLRNRLIAGVSRAVVVVEAGEKSGALITARWALEQGRDVGAVPGFPGDPRSRGANALIKMGAFAVEGARDILDAVPLLEAKSTGSVRRGGGGEEPVGPPADGTGRWREGLSAEAATVYDALGSGPTDADRLAHHVGRPVSLVQRALLELEMRGLAARDRLGNYCRT